MIQKVTNNSPAKIGKKWDEKKHQWPEKR